ncbi:MAG: hypothetical protein QM802_04250 [Agriterribacter sp.]
MRTTLKVSTVLSWINIFIGSFIAFSCLMGMLLMQNLGIVIFTVLIGGVILHSFATLQLRKSIINPAIPLSSQTPVGIRFIGFIALFFSILGIINAVAAIGSAEEVVKLADQNYLQKGVNWVAVFRIIGVVFLIFSIGVAMNVFMSTRLLRWYLLSKRRKRRINLSLKIYRCT